MNRQFLGSKTAFLVLLAVLGAGCGDTTPPDRHVALDGQSNFRDIGGYETADGRTVKWGQVYRSGEMPKLTGADVAVLEGLELQTVVNFLMPEEIIQSGRDRLPEGVREAYTPISGDRTAVLTMIAQTAITSGQFDRIPPELSPEFHRVLMEEGREEYAALLREVADPANRPLVFHCSHGIYRSGTATAILLSALGVPWETIREDYLLSNVYRRDQVQAALAGIRQGVAEMQGVEPHQIDMTNVEAFYVLKGSYIDGSLEQAVADFGSMEGYIREGLGISAAEITALRDQLLE